MPQPVETLLQAMAHPRAALNCKSIKKRLGCMRYESNRTELKNLHYIPFLLACRKGYVYATMVECCETIRFYESPRFVTLLMCVHLEVWIRYYFRWAQAVLECVCKRVC